MNFPFLY